MEHAQAVWERACQLICSAEPPDKFAVAEELLRVAKQDVSAIRHALVLGRHRLGDDWFDADARRGVNLLEEATAFLGLDLRAR